MARVKRAKKERAVKIAMAGCPQERGHQVTGWKKISRKMQKVRIGSSVLLGGLALLPVQSGP
jgi:hypothetical protein